jgi:acyl-CoA thioesterase YciA
MPSDSNQYGDIFGSWLLGQMDIAGGIFVADTAQGRTATIAVDAMTFKKPVNVGDVMCVYTDLIRIGTTSITVHVEAWVIRRIQTARLLVTEGNFAYVALGDDHKPRSVTTNRCACCGLSIFPCEAANAASTRSASGPTGSVSRRFGVLGRCTCEPERPLLRAKPAVPCGDGVAVCPWAGAARLARPRRRLIMGVMAQ